MTELSRSSIVINADPAAVMSVIADFPSYPQWITFIQAVEVLDSDETGRATVVRFVLDAGVVVDDYALAYSWLDDGVSWQLVRATSIKAMDGSYRLTPTTGGTELAGSTVVDYTLSIDIDMPLLGVFKRKAEQVLIDTALRALKVRVEA